MALDTTRSTYEELRAQWCDEIDRLPNSVEKGREFAIRISSQYLEVDPNDENFHWTDGPNDGGIDIAYLDLGDGDTDDDGADEDPVGTTWWIFQCKYAGAPSKAVRIFEEGQKLLATIFGNKELRGSGSGVAEKLRNFCLSQGGELDRLVYAVATIDPLDHKASEQLDDLRKLGASKSRANGPRFEVIGVSVKSVHERLSLTENAERVELDLRGEFTQMSEDSWVGSVAVSDLYQFLKRYRSATNDLDQIYEKNVRRWLGFNKSNKVNYGLRQTIENCPEKLGVYNNGITLVASRFSKSGTGSKWTISTPFIVNGCQTTRTIYEVLDRKLGSGGSGHDQELSDYEDRLSISHLVVKVTTTDDESELGRITRYSNTQNAVRQRDLVSIDDHFNRWKDGVETKYGRFLEIQRGAWDSRKAYERNNPNALPRFTAGAGATPIQANDMIKVFGAGWLGFPGLAPRRSSDFLPPDGTVFSQIIALTDDEFGPDELVAANQLHELGNARLFGSRSRNAPPMRRLTRFIFYFVFIEILKSILAQNGGSGIDKSATKAILKLEDGSRVLLDALADVAAQCLDRYFGDGEHGPFTGDPGFIETQNLQRFVHSARFNRPNLETSVPRFLEHLRATVTATGIQMGVEPSLRDRAIAALEK